MKRALQFSGGKDSLAVLHLLRPLWDDLTVYWMNTGDAMPETVELATQVKATVPHFVEITADVHEDIAANGIPTDLLPASATPLMRMGAGDGVPMQVRSDCCWKNLMAPMHRRMLADGVTHLIRGQKNSDELKGPLRSGDMLDGITYEYPLEGWTDEDVFAYLAAIGVELPRFYESMKSSPDCLHCSAWWGEGRSQYLKQYHPGAYAVVSERLRAIKVEVVKQINAYAQEEI